MNIVEHMKSQIFSSGVDRDQNRAKIRENIRLKLIRWPHSFINGTTVVDTVLNRLKHEVHFFYKKKKQQLQINFKDAVIIKHLVYNSSFKITSTKITSHYIK